MCVCVYVCVSLNCLPHHPTVRVEEILHLASINRSAVFILGSTNIAYLSQHRPTAVFPCLTLKPHSTLLNPPQPFRSLPFGSVLCRKILNQHLIITATPQPRIEANWLHNKARSGSRNVTPTSVSHFVVLGNTVCRSWRG